MWKSLSKSLLLLALSVVLCCGIYPLVLWGVGQTFFPFQSNGSLILDKNGKPLGSKLIAQAFTKDEYFQARPSAASYDASASASSSLAASNYALRDRVARALGPIVKYQSGPKVGQLVGPDIERWFQQDTYQGQPHIVAQWAILHSSLAQAWIKADPSHATYVNEWAKNNPEEVALFAKEHPGIAEPKADDLAVSFFKDFSFKKPGLFPSTLTHKKANGMTETKIEATKTGTEIQSTFFDMWRQDHPDVALIEIPSDMITTSASGLDPDVTLENAEYQLDRVASKWAYKLKRDPKTVRNEIEQILQENAERPLGGLLGEKFINVLEVNLRLHERYGTPS